MTVGSRLDPKVLQGTLRKKAVTPLPLPATLTRSSVGERGMAPTWPPAAELFV